jgi:hypothetical protein
MDQHRLIAAAAGLDYGNLTVWLAESFVVGFLAGMFYGHVLWDK